MRAVLDVNVLVAAILSPTGSSATVLRRWLEGAYDLVVSPKLLEELERTLGYRKIRERVTSEDAGELIELLRRNAEVRNDPTNEPPVRSDDPDDDYLISLAVDARAVLVSGDRHLLDLSDEFPIYALARFIALMDSDR